MHFLQKLKWQWFSHKTIYNFELTSMAFIGLCTAFFTTWYWFGLNGYHLIPKSPLVTQFWCWNIKHGFHLINQCVLAFIGLCSLNFFWWPLAYQYGPKIETLRGKHCRHPIAVMGVVDMFGQPLFDLKENRLKYESK